MINIVPLISSKDDSNVICVDWGPGASGLYSKCHQNTRVVGREIALLLRFLNLETGLYFADVHLIGMSLGAHAVGYAGEYQPGIARITGRIPVILLTVLRVMGLKLIPLNNV